MLTIFASNDPSEIAFAKSLLSSAGITPYLADVYTANIEGSLGIFPQRILVKAGLADAAIQLLRDGGLIND